MALSSVQYNCVLGSLLPDLDLSESLANLSISGLSLDSRLIEPGDLFFAIPGFLKDGRDYIHSSLQSGAEVVLYQPDQEFLPDNDRVVPVANLNQKISEISGRFYSNPSKKLKLTGITGTNGKTTCTQLLANLLSSINVPVGVIGTLGYSPIAAKKNDLKMKGMTTPNPIIIQSILADFVESNISQVVMEVSSHGISQHRINSLLFETAVFTNLSHDHLDYHGNLENYFKVKKELFSIPGLKNAVINIDDAAGSKIAEDLPLYVNKLSFSLVNSEASIFADEINLSVSGITARINSPWGQGELKSKLLGKFNLQNLLAVIGAACCQGLDFYHVIKALPILKNIPGRMEIINDTEESGDSLITGPVVIVDFAHSPDALKNVLGTLRDLCSGKLWCIFGCGGNRDQEKRPIMGKIAAELADNIIITNDNAREESPEKIAKQIFSGIASNKKALHVKTKIILDRKEAINFSIKSAVQEDIVLIAGKGHESYQLLGSESFSFSDRVEARIALNSREKIL